MEQVKVYDDAKSIKEKLATIATVCYGKNGVGSERVDTLLDSLAKSKHLSIFEHESVTLKIRCSRVTQQQLTRHRLFTFTVESQYLSTPTPEFYFPLNMPAELVKSILDSFEIYQKKNHKVKKSSSRYALPGALLSSMFMTGNLRCWYEMLTKRIAETTEETYNICYKIAEIMNYICPHLFNEIYLKYKKVGYYGKDREY